MTERIKPGTIIEWEVEIKGVRDKGSNAARIVVNARGMNDRAKRGLLVEMLVL